MSERFPTARFVGNAKVSGSLYDLGEYPGLLLNESNSPVIGEVYEVDDELLKTLDDFEATSDYWRKQVEITIGAETKMGWTYEPKAELCARQHLIASGDWMEYARARPKRSEEIVDRQLS